MELVLADIDEAWERVAHIARVSVDGVPVDHEHMKRACREGRALCFSNDDGVVVVTLRPNKVTMTLELLVWVAAGVGAHGMFKKYLPQIDQIARDLGATRITFESDRLGWLRVLGGDWRVRNIEFEREVPGG